MPGFNKTGPEGKGSGTGRGLGRCDKANDTQRSDIDRDSGPGQPGGVGGCRRRGGAGRGLGQGRGQGDRGRV